ncbi:hypothetical protein G6F46_015675 [Rhizopus delemar]|nr:hypothetical protein G6F46_015675 [Rhizopus delemar]
MVTQHRRRAVAQVDDATQGLQRLRAAVDQVPGEPEARLRVADQIGVGQQAVQRRAAPLHVADHPDTAVHAGLLLQGQRCWTNRVKVWRYSM